MKEAKSEVFGRASVVWSVSPVSQSSFKSSRFLCVIVYGYYCLQTETVVTPHCIVILPNSNGMQLLLCYNNEGVYISTYGKQTKNVFLQWGETPSSVGMLLTFFWLVSLLTQTQISQEVIRQRFACVVRDKSPAAGAKCREFYPRRMSTAL